MFVCGMTEGRNLTDVIKMRLSSEQAIDVKRYFLPIYRQTGVLIFTLFVFVDYGPLPVLVIFSQHRSRVVEAACCKTITDT